jgi:hypothetical protein
MILRNLERQPAKALLTILGMSSSCAILIMGLFFSDSFDYVVNVQFGLTQRENLTVTFTEPTSTAALYEIKSLPGVLTLNRSVMCRFDFGMAIEVTRPALREYHRMPTCAALSISILSLFRFHRMVL